MYFWKPLDFEIDTSLRVKRCHHTVCYNLLNHHSYPSGIQSIPIAYGILENKALSLEILASS